MPHYLLVLTFGLTLKNTDFSVLPAALPNLTFSQNIKS